MSEDVTAVSMQVSEKAAEAALSAFKSVLDSVGRLFRELLGMEHDRARAKAQIKASKGTAAPEKTKPPNVTATNLTGIKPGEVSLKDLAENARETGEALSVSQHGFSQEDRKAIARTAKKYGIPLRSSAKKEKTTFMRMSVAVICRSSSKSVPSASRKRLLKSPNRLGISRCRHGKCRT